MQKEKKEAIKKYLQKIDKNANLRILNKTYVGTFKNAREVFKNLNELDYEDLKRLDDDYFEGYVQECEDIEVVRVNGKLAVFLNYDLYEFILKEQGEPINFFREVLDYKVVDDAKDYIYKTSRGKFIVEILKYDKETNRWC